MFDKEFDDWFKSEMPNTYKGVGKEKLESFVYDTAMAAWQARVPEGYVVVPVEINDEIESAMFSSVARGEMPCDIYKAMIEAVER